MSRPKAEINWKFVDEHLEAGCSGTEIAARLGIHPDTLYINCEKEFNIGFSAYSQQKKQSGEALLRKAQFDKAIGNTDRGDNTLLIWLGKVRLEQKETTEHLVTPETVKTFNTIIDQLDQMQKNRQNGVVDQKKDDDDVQLESSRL